MHKEETYHSLLRFPFYWNHLRSHFERALKAQQYRRVSDVLKTMEFAVKKVRVLSARSFARTRSVQTNIVRRMPPAKIQLASSSVV